MEIYIVTTMPCTIRVFGELFGTPEKRKCRRVNATAGRGGGSSNFRNPNIWWPFNSVRTTVRP